MSTIVPPTTPQQHDDATVRPSLNRVHGARLILLARADTAKASADACADPDSQHAAALRGKAAAFREAAAIVARLENGKRLRRWPLRRRGDA